MSHAIANPLTQPLSWRVPAVGASDLSRTREGNSSITVTKVIGLCGLCLLYLLGAFPWLVLMYFWVEF